MDIGIDNCETCMQEAAALIDQVSEAYPIGAYGADIPQEAAGIMSVGMYALGILHERGHAVPLMPNGKLAFGAANGEEDD